MSKKLENLDLGEDRGAEQNFDYDSEEEKNAEEEGENEVDDGKEAGGTVRILYIYILKFSSFLKCQYIIHYFGHNIFHIKIQAKIYTIV